MAAAARGHHSVLAALLDAGLDADAVDERGVHVLTAAAGGGREDAELPEARKRETETRRSSRACVRTLLAAGADADARMSRLGWKPLMAAAKAGDGEIVEMLIDAGARVDQTYHNGKTPLYCAAERGRLEAARALLRRAPTSPCAADRLHTDHAADAAARRGITPHDVARANGHGALAECCAWRRRSDIFLSRVYVYVKVVRKRVLQKYMAYARDARTSRRSSCGQRIKVSSYVSSSPFRRCRVTGCPPPTPPAPPPARRSRGRRTNTAALRR